MKKFFSFCAALLVSASIFAFQMPKSDIILDENTPLLATTDFVAATAADTSIWQPEMIQSMYQGYEAQVQGYLFNTIAFQTVPTTAITYPYMSFYLISQDSMSICKLGDVKFTYPTMNLSADSKVKATDVQMLLTYVQDYEYQGQQYNVYELQMLADFGTSLGVVFIYYKNIITFYDPTGTQRIFLQETEDTALDNVLAPAKSYKMMIDGQLFIIKNGVRYNALGAVVE